MAMPLHDALQNDGQTGRMRPISREIHAFLAPLVALIGDYVVRELRATEPTNSGARYYNAKTAPIPKKAFLAGARRGDFPSFVKGRRVYALREDVHRFIESSPRPVRSPKPVGDNDDDEIDRLLDSANLKKGKRQ